MDLPEPVRAAFRRFGRQGGRARARRLGAPVRAALARHAALLRWVRARFGSPSFDALGWPGGAMVDRGLADLAAGRETADALTVALASPRLRREGVPLPRVVPTDADHRLYRLLEQGDGDLAHARYLARQREVASFADVCRAWRLGHA